MDKNEQLPVVSMQLSPTEIKNKEFKRTPLGYNPKEVVTFLDTVAKTWERVQKHEKEMQEKIRSLQESLKSWENRGSELDAYRNKVAEDVRKMKAEAEIEATKMFTEVETRASEIREKTERWLEDLIAEVKETERQKSNFLIAFKSALDSHYELLQEEKETKEGLSSRLTKFLRSNMNETSETTNESHSPQPTH